VRHRSSPALRRENLLCSFAVSPAVLTSAPEAIAVALTIERSREPLRHLSTKVPKEMAWLYVLLADLF
jgi:hypothetical protein